MATRTGLCECGCGRATSIAKRTDHAKGAIKGKPRRFAPSHHTRDRVGDFWARVRKGRGCWRWTGARYGSGYGKLRWQGQYAYAHRKAWELTYGPIPPGKCVCHRCDNPPCLRPEHLFLGVNAVNMADKLAKGRQARGERAGGAKLGKADVRSIRRALAAGETQRTIAKRHGVTQTTIVKIHTGKNWAWLH